MPFRYSRTVLRSLAAERHRLCRVSRGNHLIHLSNVLKIMRKLPLRDESDSDSDSETETKEHDISVEILAELAHLLESDSGHVRHLACAIFVAVSQYLSSSVTEWEAFIRTMFVALEILIVKSTENHDQLKSALRDSSSSTATCILEVLCNVFKSSKRESGNQVFFVCLSSFLRNTDNLKTIGKRNGCLSHLLRLLCSLLGQTDVCAVFVSSVAGSFPELISCCQCCVDYYKTHKLLMIMLRLSDHASVDSSSFLILLRRYFDDVLMEPLMNNENEPLEDSPFAANQIHLQRFAVMIFLRFCFGNMRALKEDGFDQMDEWVKHQTTGFENRWDFGRNFVRLFLHEDDMVFLVLLELLNMHGFVINLEKGEGDTCPKERFMWWFEHAFNPLVLFQMFLEGLKYDHQVVVDYLISKDCGICCAEYLLKCLRRVCDSWPAVAELSLGEPSPPKKLKGCDPFDDTKTCLLSLKHSVEKLHQKKLFPYNPRPLLKRLEKFQSLCTLT